MYTDSSVAHGDYVGMPKKGVGVEVYLGVESHDVAGSGSDERIHLHLRTVLLPEEGIKLGHQLDALLERITRKTETEGDLAGLKGRTKQLRMIFHFQAGMSITRGSPRNLRRYLRKALGVGASGEPSCTKTTLVFRFGGT